MNESEDVVWCWIGGNKESGNISETRNGKEARKRREREGKGRQREKRK